MRSRVQLRFPVCRFDFTYRLAARELPLLEIELAIPVEIETLEKLRLICFPVGKQRTDVSVDITTVVRSTLK